MEIMQGFKKNSHFMDMDFFQRIKQEIQFDFSYIVKQTNALCEFDHEF